jgi:hypothetical protein
MDHFQPNERSGVVKQKQQPSKQELTVAAEAHWRAQAEDLIHHYHLGKVRDYLGGGGPGDDHVLAFEIAGLAAMAAENEGMALRYAAKVFLDLAREAGVRSQVAQQTAIRLEGDVVRIKRQSKGVKQS